jgi:hypothetical protein
VHDNNPNRLYSGILIGPTIRGQLSKTFIFRNRSGNGFYGSQLRQRYQDKYNYIVPTSINHPNGDASRIKFSQAILNWQTLLSTQQKNFYNSFASKHLRMSGYNLYIRLYMLDEV